MKKKLNPLLHNELRLAIMSILVGSSNAEFTYLKSKTGATSGNLSVQLTKLEEAGFINIEKGYKGKVPLTVCTITNEGIEAFEEYVHSINQYLKHT